MLPPLHLCESILSSCVDVFGRSSSAIQLLVTAHGLPALHAIGSAIQTGSSVISRSTSVKACICASTLPEQSLAVIDDIITKVSLNQLHSTVGPDISFEGCSLSAWAVFHQSLCAAVENSAASHTSSLLISIPPMLSRLARLTRFTPPAITAYSNSIKQIAACSNASAAAVMCKESIRHCVGSAPSSESTAIDLSSLGVILHVFHQASHASTASASSPLFASKPSRGVGHALKNSVSLMLMRRSSARRCRHLVTAPASSRGPLSI
jgi:hypothetical protein